MRIILFICILLYSLTAFGQDSKSENNTYGTVTIEFFDQSPLVGKDATLFEDSLHYRIQHTQFFTTISLENVSKIKTRTGSYAGKGFSWGLGFGVGYSIAEAFYINVSPNLHFRENAFSRYLLFTGICAAGGALIGALIPIHQTIYLGSLPNMKALEFKIEPYFDMEVSGISLKLRF